MSFRVLLVYPPASQNESGAGDLGRDSDRQFMPYGVLTIAAELRARGFEADVVNLATSTRQEAIAAIQDRPADLIGLSCYTFHRHATAALGAEIKRLFPECHLSVGGPHVSVLPLEWLAHYRAFDSVVVGEGEATVVELAQRLDAGEPLDDVPGTAYRAGDSATLAPPRPFLADLDALAKPWEHFDYGFLITARGCPGQCTFCSSPKLWGQKIRFRSAESVLEEIEELVCARGHRFLNVKDDTFTAGKKRAIAICQGIVDRGLVFRWVCDTRADRAGPELLAAMRKAGCVRINLGVESGSPEILRNLKKRVDPEQALKATADARELGMDVRFYLIMGSRGETPATLRQTLEFVDKARPTTALFHGLALYPGTEDFEFARRQGLISVEDYFDPGALGRECFNLGENSPRMTHVLNVAGGKLFGNERVQTPYTTGEREQILDRHPDMLLSYTDLATRYAQEWRLDDAERVLRRALERWGEQTPEILHHLACLSFARRDFSAAQGYFHRALEASPQDTSLRRSWVTIQAAGPMDFQEQGQMAQHLLANLRSMEFIYLPDGARQLTLPLTNAGA